MKPESHPNPRRTDGCEELLAQAPFVRRLARALVRDEHGAEDLAQDAWVIALERAPGGGALRAWLATVLRNRARNAGRDGSRREARESLAERPREQPPTDAAYAKLEMQHRLTELVLGLAEPYRTALFLRYYEDLAPARIAAHLGVPVKTVKTRLARGLTELRARMDARNGGDRGAWLAALAPLTLRAADAVLIPTLTGVVMKKVVFAAIVLVLAGTMLSRLVGPGDSRVKMVLVPQAPPPLLSEDSPVAGSGEEPAHKSRLVAREAIALPAVLADPGFGALDVNVRWADGAAASAVGIHVTFNGPGVSREQVLVAQSDASGLARFERLPAGEVKLRSDRSSQRADAVVRTGERGELEFVLAPGLDVAGSVLDPDGRAVAGAEIWAEGTYRMWPNVRLIARAGADGSFRLNAMGADARIGARAPGFQPSPLFEAKGLPEGATGARSLTLTLGAPGGRLRGRVLAPDGEPIAGAQVLAGPRGGHNVDLPNGLRGVAAKPAIVETDEAGEFVYPGDLPPGEVPVHALAPGLPAWSGTVTIGAGEGSRKDHFLEITLEHPARIEGRLLTEGGEPVAGGRVLVAVEDRGGWYHHQVPPPRTTTDEDGRFVLEGVAPGEREVNATPRHGSREGRARVRVECVARETTRIELFLDRGQVISGSVVDTAGNPLSNWSVNDQPEAFGQVYPRQDATDANGRFVLTNVGACRHTLQFRPSGYYGSAPARLDDVAPGTTDLVVVVDTSDAPTAFVRGILRDVDSRPPEDARLTVRRGTERSAFFVEFDAVDGTFAHGPLLPGTYTLGVLRGGTTVFTSEPFTLAANGQHDVGLIQLGELGSVSINVIGLPEDDRARLRPRLDRTGSGSIETTLEDGRFVAKGAAPGEWLLTSRNSPWFLPDTIVTVHAGEEMRVEWAARPVAREVRAACVFEQGGQAWSTLRVEVRDEDGDPVWLESSIDSSRLREGRIRLHEILLPAGRFTILASTDTGPSATLEFEIDPDVRAPEGLELMMR